MSPEQIENHLYKLNLEKSVREEFLQIIEGSPARQVGKAAKNNVVVRHWSVKNQRVHVLESHTVERLCALELELDQDVVAYYPQARCAGISRRNGRHITGGTVDFMAIKKSGVAFIECKALGALHALLSKAPDDWVVGDDGGITRPPYLKWAVERSATYQVWTTPPLFATYLANLQLVYSLLAAQQAYDERLKQRVFREIARSPRTIDQLMQADSRITPQLIACMLGAGEVHGPLRNVALSDIDRFMVFSSAVQAGHADQQLDQRAAASTSQVKDSFTEASSIDLRKGMQRLERVNELIALGKPYPSYWAALIKQVIDARQTGENELALCITNYSRSGNRGSKLPVQTDETINKLLTSHWDSGKANDIGDLHAEVAKQCKEKGWHVPSRKTIQQRIKMHDAERRVLATGGLRAYHSWRSASDPRNRSAPPQAKYLVLEIDSTKCDNRSLPNSSGELLLQAPLLYSGIDGCTNQPMCHAFVFGPARSDGVALMLRDYVQRHDRLPNEIRIDRGSENNNRWLKGFCERYSVHLVMMPSGGSRYKGGIENLLGRVNSQVSHRLAGSTRPDQAGRSVDGKFKSYRTARLHFLTVREEITKTLYGDFSLFPNETGETPDQQGAISELHFPSAGIKCMLDEEMLFLTSIPVQARAFNPEKGIRVCGQTFTSDELLAAWRQSEIEGVRRDPSDPSLIRVQLRRGNVRAWSKTTAKIAQATDGDRQFHNLYGFQVRGEGRESRDEARRIRYWRLTAANLEESTNSIEEQADPERPPDQPPPKPPVQKIRFAYSDLEDIGDLT